MRAEVAIVGGGAAGLSAAYALTRRGVPFVLLEATPRFGGVIRTETEAGFRFEAGPDSLFAQKPEGVALCRELGLGDRLVPTNPDQRAVYVLHRGRLHALPEGLALAVPTKVGPFLRSRLFSWPGKMRMGFEVVLPRRRDAQDESIASFLRRRFGRESVDLLGEPLLAGIHAGDPERLSIRATFPRFVELEQRYGSLVRGMWRAMPDSSRSGRRAAAFYTLRDGLDEMVNALVARLPPASLRSSTTVRAIARGNDGFSFTLDRSDPVSAKTVILALPASQAASLLDPLDAAIGKTLAAIPFTSSAAIYLGFRRADVGHPLDGYGMVVPKKEGLRLTALSFFSTKFAGRAPEDHVLIRAFLGGARDPDVLELNDQALVALALKEAGPILGLRGAPVLVRLYRWPRAMPQMEVGHKERIAEMDRRLREIPGLFVTGAGIRTTGIPDGVADGARVAEAAAAYLQSGSE